MDDARPLTFGSLFAGIGGFDLGLERAGMVCRWQVEINPYATAVLERHWPGVKRWTDVRTFPPPAWIECECCDNFICTWHCNHAHDCSEDECPDLETWDCEWGINPYEQPHPLWCVDVICAGFPCQDISHAWRGPGLAGERSGLFFEAMRVVRQLGPKYIVLENVSALLARGLDRVLGSMASIGYDAEWHCIQAADVGAPHVRDRVFVIGIRSDKDVPDSSLPRLPIPKQEELCGARRREERRAVAECNWWSTEPDVARVAHGVSSRVDRIRCLGNAVVPQVAEVVGMSIVNHWNVGGGK